MKKYLIIAAVLAFSIIVCLIDAVLQPNYFVKIPIKIVFFLALPMIFFIRNKEDFKDFKSLFVFRKKRNFQVAAAGNCRICRDFNRISSHTKCIRLFQCNIKSYIGYGHNR